MTFNFKTAEKLPNGAEIIERAKRYDFNLVLAKYRDQFVTWRVDELGNAFWGNYFNSPEKAQQDFTKRLEHK